MSKDVRKAKFRKVFVFAYMKQLTTSICNKNSYHKVVKHLMVLIEWSKIKYLCIENQIFKSSIFCEIFLKSWFTYQYKNNYNFYDPKDVASYIISKCVYKKHLIEILFSNNFNSYWKSFKQSKANWVHCFKSVFGYSMFISFISDLS